ncbi:MAG: hypothetical protein R2844_18145 [Caldilineales bacterium]
MNEYRKSLTIAISLLTILSLLLTSVAWAAPTPDTMDGADQPATGSFPWITSLVPQTGPPPARPVGAVAESFDSDHTLAQDVDRSPPVALGASSSHRPLTWTRTRPATRQPARPSPSSTWRSMWAAS